VDAQAQVDRGAQVDARGHRHELGDRGEQLFERRVLGNDPVDAAADQLERLGLEVGVGDHDQAGEATRRAAGADGLDEVGQCGAGEWMVGDDQVVGMFPDPGERLQGVVEVVDHDVGTLQ
jgi:hypothetical protein